MSGARHTTFTAAHISFSLHLIFDAKGNARMSRGESALKSGERSMALTVTLPRAIFKSPTLRGSIVVSNDDARDEIMAKIEHNAAKVLKEHMGLDLNLTVSK